MIDLKDDFKSNIMFDFKKVLRKMIFYLFVVLYKIQKKIKYN